MVFGRFMELLAPVNCLGCGLDGAVFCTTCIGAASKMRPVCFRCGQPSFEGKTCEACLGYTQLAGASVGAFYEGSVKELILRLKFYRLRLAHEAAARLVTEQIPAGLKFEIVTSVPVSAGRYRERGYNQSELIAKLVARQLGLPYLSLLGRLTSTHQMGVSRAMRLQQIAGAFFVLRRLRGERVLIVDDVITTGATLSECASTLVAAGAESVWGAVVARH